VKIRKATLATNVVGFPFPSKGGAVSACNGTKTNKIIYLGGKKTQHSYFVAQTNGSIFNVRMRAFQSG
jgi:hypothetical protein